jgi:hypothetical protein
MKKLFLTTAIAATMSGPLFASEVYIDQAGSSTNINILQESGNNRVNTETSPMIVNGNDINVEIVQDGDGNVAEIYIRGSANDTNFEYRVDGDLNEILANIDGGTDNNFVAAIVGNDNTITLCKNITLGTCNGISVNFTDTTLNLTGNNNQINFALDAAEAKNVFDIGKNAISDFNVVNLTQAGAGKYTVNFTLDGDGTISKSSEYNLTQTGAGNHLMNIIFDGNSNTANLTQTGAVNHRMDVSVTGNINTVDIVQH